MLGSMRDSLPSVVYHCHMTTTPTTTATTKPKRRRARRRKTTAQVELPVIKPVQQITTVERVKPDVQLISRDAYWNDFQARMQLHEYEVGMAMHELKLAVAWTNSRARKLCDRIQEVAP